MKGIRLLFTACIAPLIMNTAVADNVKTVSRSVPRRTATVAHPTSARERGTVTPRKTTPSTTSTTTARTAANTSVRERTATTATRAISSRTATTPQKKTLSSRTATTPTRSATTARSGITTRSEKTRTNTSRLTNRGRSATSQPTITREGILARDATKCRSVFYECMDEFCANKDTQLKRCACSTRINEFRGLQENLDLVEEKLLDFGQRLLTVSMDKEDAAVLNQATAGELAFDTADKSESKKHLDEIAKKLNTSFDDSNFDQNLNAISLSLDMDSAFDSIDSMAAASTTTKSGTALYSAAMPVCREMALEVCSPEELSIAEGGYQMLIEQDCNTVKKTFQTQSDQARTKVFENSALLDMSRLEVHQQRNSDDILTCKSKMLDMLTNSTVCGEEMGKCLDTSGQYINPSTGAAILSTNLANLRNLIIRPSSDTETWSSKNSRYVLFLDSKRKFLEPAMEKCQDVSDIVWDQFIDDALAQIKLAQDAKLEQVRQSCTTLTTQCLDNALQTITDFDERALSVFGVSADRTAAAMCSEVKTACSALFAADINSDTDNNENPSTSEWESGITDIALGKTYETIMSTCREIGRNCIVKNCAALSDSFGLCNDITNSVNRHSILERKICWDDVINCIADAGDSTINEIMESQNRTTENRNTAIYQEIYGFTSTDDKPINDICSTKCNNNPTECYKCLLAEEIWGNCKYDVTDTANSDENKILTPVSGHETLLSWFADNTYTINYPNNCSIKRCPIDYVMTDTGCNLATATADDYLMCQDKSYFMTVTEDDKTTTEDDKTTNCCQTNKKYNQYCCNQNSDLTDGHYWNYKSDDLKNGAYSNNKNINDYYGTNYDLCWRENDNKYTPIMPIQIGDDNFTLMCISYTSSKNILSGTAGDKTVNCDGIYVLRSENGIIVDPLTIFGNTTYANVISYYYPGHHTNGRCEFKCVIDPEKNATSKPDSGNNNNIDNINTIKIENITCSWTHTDGETTCETPAAWSVDYNN